MKKAMLLVGARPNYMKIAPIWRAIKVHAPDVEPVLVHTGQHYDKNMSDVFFQDLNIPHPDICLNVGSGTHATQTGNVMIKLEPILQASKPDVLVVVGDVNSTLAGALVATKLGIPVAHVEAGLRSYDRTMPEEINRIATDAISDLLLTSCKDAEQNLLAEGVAPNKIHFVGNTMIDSLITVLPKARESAILQQLNLTPGKYVCTTLHRPSNVDNQKNLKDILQGLVQAAGRIKIVFAVHPRTKKTMDSISWAPGNADILMLGPTGYLDFLCLESNAAAIITDSGGIQEETSFLGIPCLTVRDNTERPVTITHGSNKLIKPNQIFSQLEDALNAPPARGNIELWDGKAANRILEVLQKHF